MDIGDLVCFKPPSTGCGSLTAVKYFQRIKNRINGKSGIIIQASGKNFFVIFGNELLVINKEYLALVKNES
ncbi:MAG: hypothetical protein CBC29_06135 [Methylococcaceae bacterium TMED69]|nr:MAG: hypothetical protein CBC29_06135 [Methylococcaceae bacterium TMED69]|tara:strand:+ start:74 stop:286 length:213 start_codon:yes stop_codon:yes gene_type:complete